jgi:endonuclease/exonuclease/phosphatase family metal-dependent hydrolase
LIVVNILAAATLMLSYLSVYISPARFWIFAFLGLSYPYLLLLNILFCLFWLFYRKREFLLSLIAILIGWKTLANHIRIHPFPDKERDQVSHTGRQERMEQDMIKVLSFNVHDFNLYNWNRNPASLNAIINFIKDEDPDIICLQEYFAERYGKVTMEDMYRALDKTPYRYIYYTFGEKANGRYGIATFSSFPITGKGAVRFENTLNVCIFTDIAVGKDTLRIYNNHLQSIYLDKRNYLLLDSIRFKYNEQQINELKDISFRLKNAFVKRARQADKISGHIKDSPYPVIICGDFNDTPSSYTYHRIRNGYADSFVSAGSGLGNTYAGKFPSFRIDYILHDREIQSLYFKRIRIGLSDHYPVISILKLHK